MGKVKYGLKNVHYAMATIDEKTNTATYSTPRRIPGAVNLSLGPQGDATNFYADDGVYFTVTTNNGYEGDLELALIPEDFKCDALGEIKDSNGVFIDDTAAVAKPFALLFEFAEDVRARRHVMYNCVASRPSVAGQTKGESTEPSTETTTITARAIHIEAINKDITKSNTGDASDNEVYGNWYNEVYVPTSLEASGDLSPEE